jgi:hypothetical protein
MKFLHQAAGPADRCLHRAFGIPESEKQFLAGLREKTRASLQSASLPADGGLNRDYRADRVAVAFRALQAERNCGRQTLHHVLENAQLRSVAVFQKHFLAPVMIKIGDSKSATILDKIQTDCAGNIGKCSIAIVRVENIALIPAPGAVGAE